MDTVSPDDINASAGKLLYRCFCCRKEEGLHWHEDTAMPVCDSIECIDYVEAHFQNAMERLIGRA